MPTERGSKILDLSGRVLGGFKLIEVLGRGAMATVYRAREEQLERDVAVKVLHQSFTADESFLARFKAEAKISASLEHANIVSIYAVGEENDIHWFAMKLIRGKPLDEVTTHKTLFHFEEALPIMRDILKGLSYAHKKKIIHRDVKQIGRAHV